VTQNKSSEITKAEAQEANSSLKELDLPSLVGGIVQDTGTLLGQQVQLLRAELTQEARRAGGAVAAAAAGGGLLAAGGLLSGMMLAELLHSSTKLPLWLCYGAIGGGLGATGYALLRKGSRDIGTVQVVPPPETAAALKENVAWAKQQIGIDP
jgi:hypothetical protein